MKIGETVRTAIALPGIPAGTTGTVKEIGRLFVVVTFEDGREGYYAPRQLGSVLRGSDSQDERFGEPVPFGIGGLQVPRGSHSCLLASTQRAALNAAASYTAAGLDNGETAVCGVPNGWRNSFLCCLGQRGVSCDQETGRGRLVIINPSRIYLSAQRFDPRQQVERTVAAVVRLAAGNPNGSRAFAHVGGRPRLAGWWEYESQITPAAKDAGVTCLCVYDASGRGMQSWHMAARLHDYVVRDDLVTRGGAAPT